MLTGLGGTASPTSGRMMDSQPNHSTTAYIPAHDVRGRAVNNLDCFDLVYEQFVGRVMAKTKWDPALSAERSRLKTAGKPDM